MFSWTPNAVIQKLMVSVEMTMSLSVRQIRGSILEPVKSDSVANGYIATAATFLRSCVVRALNSGDDTRFGASIMKI